VNPGQNHSFIYQLQNLKIMASSSVSMAKKKAPKKPKLTASKAAWDNYEKKKKAYDQHTKSRSSELARRKKVAAK